MTNIQSVTRLPKNAFGRWNDVPDAQDCYYRKTHKLSADGIKSAARRVQRELRDYTESHGSMAVRSGWLEINNQRVAPSTALFVVDLAVNEINDLDDWYAACREFNAIQAEADAEFESQQRHEMAQWEKERGW